jgi:transposase
MRLKNSCESGAEKSKLMTMSRKRNTNKLPDTKDQRIAELEKQLAQALVIIQKLQKEVEELKRAGKRQAAPFARRKWVERPKKSGRKKGQGQFAHRAKPTIKQITETKTAKLHGCPECGGKVCEIHKHDQYETDIPLIEVKTTHFITYSGYCRECHKRVRSRHPDQTSQATGAAGVLVGPRAKALAVDLKHRLGVSYGKVSEVLQDAFGLQVSRSGWCQSDQKLSNTAQPVYEALLEMIRQCSVVHADETSWRIGTLAAWLWVFTNREATVYVIRANRSSDVVIDVLGQEFKGILASDCFLAYDEKRLSAWLKQKCVSHLLTDLKEMKEGKSGRALQFARQMTLVLQEALALKRQKSSLDPFTFFQRARDLETRLDALVAPQRRLRDRDNARFAKRLRKHRPHLLRFLYVNELEATNNLAERMLRPALITRKTNGCHRSRPGAATHAILSSVLVTCRQHSIPILDYLVALQRFGGNPVSLVSPLPLQPDIPSVPIFER